MPQPNKIPRRVTVQTNDTPLSGAALLQQRQEMAARAQANRIGSAEMPAAPQKLNVAELKSSSALVQPEQALIPASEADKLQDFFTRAQGKAAPPGAVPSTIEQNKMREAEVSQWPPLDMHGTGMIDNPQAEAAIINNHRHNSPNPNANSKHYKLPSNDVFYPSDIWISPLSVPDYLDLHEVRATKNEGLLIDLISRKIDRDARTLEEKDFRFILYMLRIDSSIKSPYKFTYTSIYGNRCEYVINSSILDIKPLDADPAEYHKYYDMGYCMPTIADDEEYIKYREGLGGQQNRMDYLWEKARYLRGENAVQKLEIAKTIDPSMLFEDIPEFAKKYNDYGVVEFVEAIDSKFDGAKSLDFLTGEAERLRKVVDQLTNLEQVTQLNNNVAAIIAEIDRIKQEIKDNGAAQPRKEIIRIGISVTDFFPDSE